MRYHVDTDFLVHALAHPGPERTRLRETVASDADLEMSAIAWYEFCRGPRTPEQMAVAQDFFGEGAIVAFDGLIAERAAEVFRHLGSPRKRAADIAIGVTAVVRGARLLSRNARDFARIHDLDLESTG